jgi:hypothetical protein
MEIGGLSPGPGMPADDGHDQILFTHAGDPQVTFGGTLRIDLIGNFQPVVGQSFHLFDFDPARMAGEFDSIEVVDMLAPGTEFDFSDLYTTGEVSVVVPEPGSAAFLLFSGALLMFGRPRRRTTSSC